MNNDFNQMGSMPNQNMNYGQPMNNGMPTQQPMPGPAPMPNQPMAGPQPMPNQPMNNTQGYGYNYQPAKKFTIPPIAKDTASIVGYAGALIMIIGSFLNFLTLKVTSSGTVIFDESVNYFITNGELKDGALVFLFALGALALIHFRKNLIALAPTAVAGLIVLMDYIDSNEKITEIKDLYEGISVWLDYNVKASFGPALYVILIGIVAVIVHAVLYYMNKNKAKQMPGQMMPGIPNQNMNYGQPMNNGMPTQQPMPGPAPMPNQQPMAGPQPMPNQPMPGPQPMNYNQNNQYPNNNMMM